MTVISKVTPQDKNVLEQVSAIARALALPGDLTIYPIVKKKHGWQKVFWFLVMIPRNTLLGPPRKAVCI